MLLAFDTGGESRAQRREGVVLAADAGATKTKLALHRLENGHTTILEEKKFLSRDYESLMVLMDLFLEGRPAPDVICLGVAGPVVDGRARLSNIGWEIDRREITRHFGVKQVHLINDLEATAWGLATLDEKDTIAIRITREVAKGNAVIIAPGTGLGEAGLYWDGKTYHPVATEGGHCDFASRNEFDVDLYNYLQLKFGHVSWERLVSGPGIVSIYHFLRDEKKRGEPAWLAEKMENADAAAVISRHMNESATCRETMQLFIRYLAHESANLVLKFKATGGLFIGGGIIPHIAELLKGAAFYSSFCQSGRLNYLLDMVPVSIIMNPNAALLGAAYYGGRLLPEKEKV